MQSTTTQPSALFGLPNDVLSLIISKLATNSREDVSSCVLACPELATAANDYQVFRTMNLQDIVVEPLLAVTTYPELMAECLLHSNPSAQYITGFLEYFHNNNPVQSMLHLHHAAHADEPIGEAVYLYGIIKMCTGEFEVGKTYLRSLGSHADDVKSKQCWKSIKKALHGIGHVERAEYAPSLFAMLPPYECNLYDMKNSCPKCYFYKKMFRFIYKAPKLSNVLHQMLGDRSQNFYSRPPQKKNLKKKALNISEDEANAFYTVEYPNSLKCSVMPTHKLQLKVNTPVILMRNINQKEGLCNGTRLLIKRLGHRVLETQILTGPKERKQIFLPKIVLITTDTKCPYKLRGRQFPVRVCYAMTINKSQGQSLDKVGLYLPKPVFNHGKLYVAISRVRTYEGLKICNMGEGEGESKVN